MKMSEVYCFEWNVHESFGLYPLFKYVTLWYDQDYGTCYKKYRDIFYTKVLLNVPCFESNF